MIELRILREVILEGDDGRAVEDQSLTGTRIGHIILLAGRDVQCGGQDFSVSACLIQKVDKIGVLEDVLHLTGGKQILDILGDAGRNAPPFSETLPDLDGIRCRLFLLEQKVELVHVVAGCLVLGAVDGHSVPDLILNDEHSELLELLAQLLDVVAHEAVIDIYIRPVIEDIQRAVNIDFKGSRNALCLRFGLLAQDIVEVFENGHFLRHGIREVVLIDHADASVNDGLLNRLQALLAADNQLAHGKDEVGFQRQRVFLFGVVEVDVQRIDVVRAYRRDADDLTAELLDKGEILCFGVTDDDVILGDEEGIGHLSLCREGFTAAGSAEDQPVGVLELLAVYHDHVVGQSIQTVIESLTLLKKLLRHKRDKDCRRRGGQATLDLNLVETDGKAAHQTFLLLEVQPLENAVVLLRDGCRLEHRVFELLAGACGVHQKDGDEEHSLIPCLEVLQQTLRLTAEGSEIGRKNVHVVAGTDSLFLLFDLHLVEVGDLHLDGLDSFCLIDGADMKIDRDVAVHVKEVSEHTVIQLRREDLQEAHRADGLAHLEALAFTEIEGGGSDEVLTAQSGTGNHVKGEAERLIAVHVEDIVQHFQSLVAGESFCFHTEGFEVVENIRLNSFELGLCGPEILSLDAEGDVLALEQAVVALQELVLEHIGILLADVIELVILFRNVDRLLELADARSLVDEGELNEDGAVEVVEEVTPILENGGLVLVLGKLVVDVVKTDGFGVETAVHLADTVLTHLDIGDRLLRGLGNLLCLLVLFLLHDDFLLFLSGERIAVDLAVPDAFLLRLRSCLGIFAVQAAIPPFL